VKRAANRRTKLPWSIPTLTEVTDLDEAAAIREACDDRKTLQWAARQSREKTKSRPGKVVQGGPERWSRPGPERWSTSPGKWPGKVVHMRRQEWPGKVVHI
jgi:hypothetical protein